MQGVSGSNPLCSTFSEADHDSFERTLEAIDEPEDLVSTGLRESLADEVLKHGPFHSIDQLDDVPGIGPATLNKIRPYLKILPEVEKPAP